MAITAKIYRDGEHWTVEIPKAKGFVGTARSLSQLRKGMRKALDEFYPALAGEEIRELFELPATAKKALKEIEKATEEAQRATIRAQELKRRGAHQLRKTLGISIRDIGSLVGISGARAQQLLEDE